MKPLLYIKFLLVLFLLNLGNISHAQNWFLVSSKNTGQGYHYYSSQYYYEDLKKDIKTAWDNGYYITNVEYNGYFWIATFSTGTNYTNQTWIKHDVFPQETINEKWEAGYYITEIAYGEGEWLIVMSQGTGYTDDLWRTRTTYAEMKTEIQAQWDRGYRITNIEYGAGVWAFSMALNSGIDAQTFKPSAEIPADWIKEKWEEGYDITEVGHDGTEWVVVCSKGYDLSQTYKKDESFPVDWVQEKVDEGYVITSFCSSTNNQTVSQNLKKEDSYYLTPNEAFVVNTNYTSRTKQTFKFTVNDLTTVKNTNLVLLGVDYDYDTDGDYTDFKIVVNDNEVYVGQLNSERKTYNIDVDLFGFDIREYLVIGDNTITIQNTEDEGQGDYAFIYSVAVNYDTDYNISHGRLIEAEYLHVKTSPKDLKINYMGNDDNYTVVNVENTGFNSSCIGADSYIIDKATNKKYYLLKAENIPLCSENIFKFTSNFTLYFEQIPLSAKNIDIIEPTAEGTSYSFQDVSFEFKQKGTEVAMPPILKIGDISFSENVLNAGETAQLTITIQNVGPGDANDVYVDLFTETTGITFPKKTTFPIIKANGGSKTVTIDVIGEMNLTSSEAEIKIDVIEPHFMVKIPGKQLKFKTRAFEKPEIILAQYAVLESQSAIPNKQIDINEILELKLVVQNIGQGNAENITVDVVNKQTGVMFLGVMKDQQLIRQNPKFSTLNAGKYETIIYRYFVNSEFSDSELQFTIKTNDITGNYGFTAVKSFPINKELSESGYIREIDNPDERLEGTVVIEDIPNEVVDVDENIPNKGKNYPNRFALIIGNANYQKNGSDVVDISYSLNDAKIFKEYAVNVLGIPDDERNIMYLEDAKSLELKEYVENFSQLMELKPEGSEFFVFYSGHGTLDSNKNSYILPVDVKTKYVESYAYKLDDFYKNITPGAGKKTYVFLDACFSGGGKTGVLVPYTKVGLRQSKKQDVAANILVFAASSGAEISQEYAEKQHGLFTYFLLKALQNSGEGYTFGQLGDQIKNDVKSETLVPSKKLINQTPTIKVNPSIQNEWRNWKVNP